ncbi:MAG: MFS transporter [Alphaproteobacteria bacterium]|nr:MFS transporter [Alphaproteobacteria bacterium]
MKTAVLTAKREKVVETPSSRVEGLNSRQSWAIWACAGAFYLYEMILRVSPSVMTEGLMLDFSLTNTALGVLSSFYYFAYTPLQIPCGVMVDVMGTRRIITISAALCALGSFLFASSDTLLVAQIGRFLVGAGSACAFLSCLKVTAEWFTPTRFALMSGMTTMMGTVGGTFGGPPLAWMVNNCGGWRQATITLAAVGVGMTLFSWFMIRDYPVGHRPHHTNEMPLKKALVHLVLNPQVWLIGLFGSLMYLPISAFAELWGVPYLMHTYGIDNEYASMASIMIFVGFALGCPLAAWVSDKIQSRVTTMKISALIMFGIFMAIVFGPVIPLPLMFGLLFLGGVCNGGQVLAFACVKEISSKRISGSAIGFTNAIVMLSGVIFQPLLGKILDLSWDGTVAADGLRVYSEVAYQTAMIAIPVGIAASWLLLLFVKETHHYHRTRTQELKNESEEQLSLSSV